MTFQTRLTVLLLVAGLLHCLGGCAKSGRPEPPRYPVSGTVTLDGTPLEDGAILFLSPELGLIDRVPIQQGRFQGAAAAGKRRVEFSIVREMPFTGVPMPGIPAPKTVPTQILPARYHAESTLSADVVPGGPNAFTFELTSK
jgi:hypothetical protein